MTEIGETVERIDLLIAETKCFQQVCDVDIERAEEVVAIGKLSPVCVCVGAHVYQQTTATEMIRQFDNLQASNW